MKHPIIAVLLFLIISNLQAQEDTSKLEIDKFINRFNSKMDTVFWLCEYDNIASVSYTHLTLPTSDLV